MTVVYQDSQSPLPDRVYQGRVQLVEVTHTHMHTTLVANQRRERASSQKRAERKHVVA